MSGPSADPALLLLDVERLRGLEIGPLARPRVKKSDGQIFYVDHCSTEELRQAYSANSLMRPHLDEIVDVDYVIKDGLALSEAVGSDGPFDYIIASHVLEHLADPIGWLEDVRGAITRDGLVSLVVPDKRFCFDVNRSETRPQDWVDWYLRDLRAPSYGQLFDFFAHVTTIDGMVDTLGLWAGTVDYEGARRTDVPDPDVAAFANCVRYRDTGAYMDVHAGVYTPSSLLSLIEMAINLDLLHFEVAFFSPTQRDSLEFHLALRAASHLPKEQMLASVVAARAELVDAPTPTRVPPPPPPPAPEAATAGPVGTPVPVTGGEAPGAMEVSEIERRLIHFKRTVMGKLRAVAGKW
jgi:hypothetical protein